MMNMLFHLAFLVFIALFPAHARILPDLNIPRGEKFDMIISIYWRPRLSPPPSPSSSPPRKQSTAGADDHDQYYLKSPSPPPRSPGLPVIQMPGNNNVEPCSVDQTSTTSSSTSQAEDSSRENMESGARKRSPPPPPRRPPPITPKLFPCLEDHVVV